MLWMAATEPSQSLREGFRAGLVDGVIEQQKHKALDLLMQEALFAPLGMTRTGIIYRTEFAANVADVMPSLALHEAFHVGQLSLVRKKLGLGPKFG